MKYIRKLKISELVCKFLERPVFRGQKGNSVFTATADVIAGALNTAIFASLGFTNKFDFKTFGNNVAHGFNEFSGNLSGSIVQKQ